MKTINKFLLLALSVSSALCANAQSINSGYFVEGNLYRNQLNPALTSTDSLPQNYVAVPALGNIALGLSGNTALSSLLYNVNGKTVLFTNPGVSASEVMSNIKDKNRITENMRMSILSFGFRGFGGYNTIAINLRENLGVTLPGQLVGLAKESITGKTYDLGLLNSHADAYVELAFGHQRKIDDKLKVGAALKVLLGGGNVDLTVDKALVSLGQDKWTIETDARLESSIKGLEYKTKKASEEWKGDYTSAPKPRDYNYVNDMKVNSPGINGFGLGIDLGAEYKINEDWKVSAAILDLGFISWSNNLMAASNATFTTDKYEFSANKDDDNKFSREFDRLKDGLSQIYRLEDKGDQGGRSTMLATTINLGGEYTLPVYRKLSFGALFSTRLHKNYGYTEGRISANWRGTKTFTASANVAYGTYGADFGWVLNYHPQFINIFLAMDHTFGSVAKQFIPVSGKGSINFGLSVPF